MQNQYKLNLNINEKNILYTNTYYYSYFIYLCKWRKRDKSWWPDRRLGIYYEFSHTVDSYSHLIGIGYTASF